MCTNKHRVTQSVKCTALTLDYAYKQVASTQSDVHANLTTFILHATLSAVGSSARDYCDTAAVPGPVCVARHCCNKYLLRNG